MKALNFSILTTVILALGALFHACSDDDTKAITLKDFEGTTISLTYPSASEAGYSFPIEGGDGGYTVKSGNGEIVTAEIISFGDLRLKAINIGETTVSITDKSKNTLVLNIKVDYQTENYVIRKHDIRVIGGDLTENQKKTITEKFLAEIPVKVGGGYKFIYTDRLSSKGKAIIYTDLFGSNGIETTFEFKQFENTNIPESLKMGYEITINDEKRNFVVGRFIPTTKTTETISMAFIEDITQKVQEEYSKAEFVYTSQLLGRSY